jgi:hypothetical protein
VVILIIDHKKKFLLQLTILAALKLTRANAQNIIFVAGKNERDQDAAFYASVWYFLLKPPI